MLAVLASKSTSPSRLSGSEDKECRIPGDEGLVALSGLPLRRRGEEEGSARPCVRPRRLARSPGEVPPSGEALPRNSIVTGTGLRSRHFEAPGKSAARASAVSALLLVPLQSRRCSQASKAQAKSTEAGRILPPHTVPVKDAPVCHTIHRRRWRPARHLPSSPGYFVKKNESQPGLEGPRKTTCVFGSRRVIGKCRGGRRKRTAWDRLFGRTV